MHFDVTIQGHEYKTMEGNSVGDILKQITSDILANKILKIIPSFDINEPHNITITPKNNSPT